VFFAGTAGVGYFIDRYPSLDGLLVHDMALVHWVPDHRVVSIEKRASAVIAKWANVKAGLQS